MEKREVLIIKTGYSEVLDSSQHLRKTSFGDILRTTVLLNLYKEDNVTWVTDKSAFPLLESNPYINELLELDFTNGMYLLQKDFDILINLEKDHDICQLASMINAWVKYGFRLDKKTNKPEAYDRASEALAVSADIYIKKTNRRQFQELVFEMVGQTWRGEEYVIGYTPKINNEYDVALNTIVGPKWPAKAWPIEKWDQLEQILTKEGLKVTRQDKQNQEILTNLFLYMDWINSAKLIITNDSLGMHLGLAFKKKVLAFFSSSHPDEVYFYGRGKPIFTNNPPYCFPCFGSVCKGEKFCLADISVEQVYDEVKKLYPKI